MIKLRIKNENGLRLLRASDTHYKLVRGERGLVWQEARENARGRPFYPREVEVGPGCHEVEKVPNPFVPGGEPWLVLRGSRIGAAERFLRELAEVTKDTANGVEILIECGGNSTKFPTKFALRPTTEPRCGTLPSGCN
jgi:hypothetical protein